MSIDDDSPPNYDNSGSPASLITPSRPGDSGTGHVPIASTPTPTFSPTVNVLPLPAVAELTILPFWDDGTARTREQFMLFLYVDIYFCHFTYSDPNFEGTRSSAGSRFSMH
jgi:hypothetical protein